MTGHPLELIPWLEATLPGRELTFEFSTYSYKPQVVEDERSLFFVKGPEVLSFFDGIKARLKPDEDLAFHSRVHVNGSSLVHLPMVDFMEVPTREELARIKDALKVFGAEDCALYSSGRSLHLYARPFLNYEEWIRMLGRLLLLNIPGRRDIIDSRWVGHRLMAGYGTLRWTKNNPHYRGLPTRIAETELK
jgi:hypothetical protein